MGILLSEAVESVILLYFCTSKVSGECKTNSQFSCHYIGIVEQEFLEEPN